MQLLSEEFEIRCKICNHLVRRVPKLDKFFCCICENNLTLKEVNIKEIKKYQTSMRDWIE